MITDNDSYTWRPVEVVVDLDEDAVPAAGQREVGEEQALRVVRGPAQEEAYHHSNCNQLKGNWLLNEENYEYFNYGCWNQVSKISAY